MAGSASAVRALIYSSPGQAALTGRIVVSSVMLPALRGERAHGFMVASVRRFPGDEAAAAVATLPPSSIFDALCG
jgi:hypothetical protein